jgi:hypothetical protein
MLDEPSQGDHVSSRPTPYRAQSLVDEGSVKSARSQRLPASVPVRLRLRDATVVERTGTMSHHGAAST